MSIGDMALVVMIGCIIVIQLIRIRAELIRHHDTEKYNELEKAADRWGLIVIGCFFVILAILTRTTFELVFEIRHYFAS